MPEPFPVHVRRLVPGLKAEFPASHRRILLLARGEARAARTPERLVAPLVVSIPPGLPIITEDQAGGYLLVIDPATERRLLSEPGGALTFRDLLAPKSIHARRVSSESLAGLEAIAAEIAGEIELRGAAYEAVVFAKLVELFAELIRIDAGTTTLPADRMSVADVMEYVRSHYDEEFTLGSVASRCAMNPTGFSREFKRVSGSPLFEFINKVRIHKACALLKHSRKSVTEIAFEVGYNNVSFFNRYFRRIIGMSPTHFRSAMRR